MRYDIRDDEKVMWMAAESWVSGFSRLVCACKSRIKCCKSVHEEPDVSHAPKLGPESFYLGIE